MSCGTEKENPGASFDDSEHTTNLDSGQDTLEAPPRFVTGYLSADLCDGTQVEEFALT